MIMTAAIKQVRYLACTFAEENDTQKAKKKALILALILK